MEKKARESQKILCPICEQKIKVSKGKKHLELCKEKAELNKQLNELDDKISEIVFQAFITIEKLQKKMIFYKKKFKKNQMQSSSESLVPAPQSISVTTPVSKPTIKFQDEILKQNSGENTPDEKDVKQKQRKLSIQNNLENSSEESTGIRKESRMKSGLIISENNQHEICAWLGRSSFNLPEDFQALNIGSFDKKLLENNFYEEDTFGKMVNLSKSSEKDIQDKNSDFEEVSDLSPKKEKVLPHQSIPNILIIPIPSEGSSNGQSSLGINSPSGQNSENGCSSPVESEHSFTELTAANDAGIRGRITRSFSLTTNEKALLTPSYKKSKFCIQNNEEENSQDLQSPNQQVYDSHQEIPREEPKKPKPMLRRANTGLPMEKKSTNCRVLNAKNDTSQNDQIGQEKLEELGKLMNKTKMKIKVYKAIQVKGKLILNQKSYSKEISVLKVDISSKILAFLGEVESESTKKFGTKFLKVLEARVNTGKEFDKIDKKLTALNKDSIKKQEHKNTRKVLPKGSNTMFNIEDNLHTMFTIKASRSSNKDDKRLEDNPFFLRSPITKAGKDVKILDAIPNKTNPYQNVTSIIFEDLQASSSREDLTAVPKISNISHEADYIHNLVNEGTLEFLTMTSVQKDTHGQKTSRMSSIELDKTSPRQKVQRSSKRRGLTVINKESLIPTSEKEIDIEEDSEQNPALKRELKGRNYRHKSLTNLHYCSSAMSLSSNYINNKMGSLTVSKKDTKLDEKEADKRKSIKTESEIDIQKPIQQRVENAAVGGSIENQNDLDNYGKSAIFDQGYFSDSQVCKTRPAFKYQPKIGIEDFEPLKIVSKGAFGRVWLVRKKATKDLYAMKVINLAEKLMKNSDLENLRKENSVFTLAQEDFIVRAVFTFTHKTCICFVMEYMLGGDLGDFLCNYGALDEEVARFYIAEIILAVEYLHSLGIVHRDLKPDNILLDRNGHAKLTDFGLSETGLSQKIKGVGQSYNNPSSQILEDQFKLVKLNSISDEETTDPVSLKIKRIFSNKHYENKLSIEDQDEKNKRKGHRLVGTPDYMAPEIINSVSITSYSSDWWAVGVILFELLAGIPPFNDETPDKIYDNILNLRVPWDQIKIGYGEDSMTPEAADLSKKLLTPDPLQRLGANGAKEIKNHPFFKDINWEKLRTQQAPVTFENINETDTQNFVRVNNKITEKEKKDPFVVISKCEDSEKNLQAAKQFIETSQNNFQMINISALYSTGLKLMEEITREKAKENEKRIVNHPKEVHGKFNDLFEMPDQ